VVTLTPVPSHEPSARSGEPVALAKAHPCDLDAFGCGHPSMDAWLRTRAHKGEGKYARTHVVLTRTEPRVIAHHRLSAGAVTQDMWPAAEWRRNAPDPTPVLILGRLAVDLACQGRGLGTDLLQHAFYQSLAVSRLAGTRALVVQPIDDRVRTFYAGVGFLGFAGEAPPMFLPIEDVEKALGDGDAVPEAVP
jgi:predicted N-acetyltransferase YhbS